MTLVFREARVISRYTSRTLYWLWNLNAVPTWELQMCGGNRTTHCLQYDTFTGAKIITPYFRTTIFIKCFDNKTMSIR